jgi:hypothetical protein
MAVDINYSFLTSKAIDYAMLSELAYASWSNGVPSDYNADWLNLQKKGYIFIDQYTDPTREKMGSGLEISVYL